MDAPPAADEDAEAKEAARLKARHDHIVANFLAAFFMGVGLIVGVGGLSGNWVIAVAIGGPVVAGAILFALNRLSPP